MFRNITEWSNAYFYLIEMTSLRKIIFIKHQIIGEYKNKSKLYL